MKKIFILDDNQELLDIMRHVLSKEYELCLKDDTDDILDEINEFNPDLLILDHYIGVHSSSEIIAALRSQKPQKDLPIILFSAHPNLGEKATEVGAYGFIEKPSNISYIREYVRKVLSDNS